MKSLRERLHPDSARQWMVMLAASWIPVLGAGFATQARSAADPDPLEARFSVEAELGAVWQSRNDVQIPNDASGTRFALDGLTGSGAFPAARIYVTWKPAERHGLRVLAAPFEIRETGVLSEPVSFAGGNFAAGIPTRGEYKFNSWRLTYRYSLHRGERWRWWLGLTAKIRDAKVVLSQGDVRSEDKDVGFVPLLHLAATYRLGPRWHVLLDADALAGGPGRAEDVALKLAYRLGDRVTLTGGYRMLEGGADVSEVYNFAWFHYAVASLAVGF